MTNVRPFSPDISAMPPAAVDTESLTLQKGAVEPIAYVAGAHETSGLQSELGEAMQSDKTDRDIRAPPSFKWASHVHDFSGFGCWYRSFCRHSDSLCFDFSGEMSLTSVPTKARVRKRTVCSRPTGNSPGLYRSWRARGTPPFSVLTPQMPILTLFRPALPLSLQKLLDTCLCREASSGSSLDSPIRLSASRSDIRFGTFFPSRLPQRSSQLQI